jgi:hypothetical protein
VQLSSTGHPPEDRPPGAVAGKTSGGGRPPGRELTRREFLAAGVGTAPETFLLERVLLTLLVGACVPRIAPG